MKGLSYSLPSRIFRFLPLSGILRSYGSGEAFDKRFRLGASFARPAVGVSSAANLPLAGSLDPSFGSRGVVTHSLAGNEYPKINGIAVQPDGRVVVATGSIVRYLPAGSLDSSFGSGGFVATGFRASAVALQPDGKIVVAGESGSALVVARYKPDGALDTSFGTDGTTTTVVPGPTGQGALANALAILPEGGILAAGSAEGTDDSGGPYSSFVLAEYKPDGSLDPRFGEGGIVKTSFTGDDRLGGIAVQPSGKIVATGAGLGLGHGQEVDTMVLARYKPDGSLDPTFGTGGKVTTHPKLGYDGGPPTLQHGKIVVVGDSRDSAAKFVPVLARFEASGRLDPTFGEHGFAKIGHVTGLPSAVLSQSDGKILFAAYNSANLQQGSGVVGRLLPNGRRDPSFGRRGIVSFRDEFSVLALQTDQKILVGGGSGNAWTLTRLIGGNNCVVPVLRGKTISKASAALKKSYCRRGRAAKRFSNKVAGGRVISTAPPRGARLPGDTKVDLIISKGKRPKPGGLATGAASERQSFSGLVFRHYPGSGWRFHPLLSFGRLNNLVSAGQVLAAKRLVAALLGRGEREGPALYWRYDFPYDGGPVPWSSGFVQAVAAESLARASQLLRQPSLLRPAGAALRGLRQGLLLHVGGGLWIREYGFNQRVILNSQLQSLLSLRSYARMVASPPATRLVHSLYRATVRLLPRFDLGCHSLYQLGGPVADHHYQDYQVALLKRLTGQYPEEPLFRRLYLRWRRCA